MLERTTNVLLKEIEEPSPRTIWLLCAPSAQDVLPTIRSRTRIVNLGVPDDGDVAAYLEHSCGADRATAARVARLAEGHIGIAALYARDSQVLADRDELLKEIEEPSPRTIWLLCAPSAQDVLPTIRSRTRIVNLGVPDDGDVAAYLEHSCGADRATAARVARLAEGHIGIAALYARDSQVLADRDELVVGVLGLARASQAVLLADTLIASAKAQAQADVDRQAERAQQEFRRINGLGEDDRVPPGLRGMYNAITKKDELKRQATRRQRDVLDRALNSVASVYRDVAVLQNDAEGSVGLVNVENRKAIVDLSVALRREQVIERLDRIAVARRRLIGNVNPQLVFEALFCELLPQ